MKKASVKETYGYRIIAFCLIKKALNNLTARHGSVLFCLFSNSVIKLTYELFDLISDKIRFKNMDIVTAVHVDIFLPVIGIIPV